MIRVTCGACTLVATSFHDELDESEAGFFRLLSMGASAMTTLNLVANNGAEKWSRASLRIAGDTLQPNEISILLGLEATRSGVKGERFSSRHSAVRRTSFWFLECPLSKHLPLEEHLKWLLNLLEAKHDLIISISDKWRVEFFCGFFSENGQGGVTFDQGLLRRLAHLGIPLVLDFHLPEAQLEAHEELPLN
jgi:Domain of unknown function (DUF4279)